MKYNFDEIIDRRNTNALNTDGFRGYIFHAGPEMKFPYADDEFVRIVLHVTTPLYLFSSVAVSISACSKYKGKFSAKQLILSIFIDFL